MNTINDARSDALRTAQNQANDMFQTMEANGLIRAGITEGQLNDEIFDLAQRKYGVTKYWHKRIVRAGTNTLLPYEENPPDLMIGEDDILFVDLGPVFDDCEADFGLTFVIRSDSIKKKLPADSATVFGEGKAYFKQHPDITAAELYRHAQDLAAKYGWEYGGPIAGHLLGQFPHERIPGDKITLYVPPENTPRIRGVGEDTQARGWVLAVPFVGRCRKNDG